MRLFSILVSALILTVAAFPQYRQKALERAREVKLLQDDRETVRRALREFNLGWSDEKSDEFEFGETRVEVTYSTGECDEDEEEVWDVPAGKVVKIEVSYSSATESWNLEQDISKLRKEQMYFGWDTLFIHHNKERGFAVVTDEYKIDRVVLVPPTDSKSKTCNTKLAREFLSHPSWFGSKKLKDRHACILVNMHANVQSLSLSHGRVSAVTPKQIQVVTIAVDPENDVLTYNYVITGGRIVGTGSKVVWDLTGAAPGSYSITAAVDDGAGLVGEKVTKTIVVE